jgi:hypothetical protein
VLTLNNLLDSIVIGTLKPQHPRIHRAPDRDLRQIHRHDLWKGEEHVPVVQGRAGLTQLGGAHQAPTIR